MTIQDAIYLKQNSREKSSKLIFPLTNKFTENKVLSELMCNVFTIHILKVFLNVPPPTNFVLSVYANDIKMDSIAINQQDNINIIGQEYEKILLNPLAKVSELSFMLTDMDDLENTVNLGNGNISIIIRNYEPQAEFNNNYNELNPNYNPNIFIEDSSSLEED